MANLFFKFSSMDAGKSTVLLQTDHNYRQHGMNTYLLTAAIDDRYGVGKITSRLGISAEAKVFNSEDNLCSMIEEQNAIQKIDCVLVDESQFLRKEQVKQLALVVDHLNIPVICYGLRTDSEANLFEGSQYLLAWADKLEEIKAICDCGRKATMTNLTVASNGGQIQIGGNDIYKSVCRKHHTAFN